MKISHWYFMEANQQDLVPQTNEDIVEAKWVAPNDFLANYSMYASIRDLLTKTLQITTSQRTKIGKSI